MVTMGPEVMPKSTLLETRVSKFAAAAKIAEDAVTPTNDAVRRWRGWIHLPTTPTSNRPAMDDTPKLVYAMDTWTELIPFCAAAKPWMSKGNK
mmetsp:Transcript_58832/g.95223  ORF Transcript_58832/g.95223 Transcript_58832/m.95223 type:complete len:93 (-) Transcript_58832:196-474(-)